MPVPQTAMQAIINVKWAASTFLVVSIKRKKNMHGNGVPSGPFVYVENIATWDADYNGYHVNWDGIRRNFPNSQVAPPKVKDLGKTLRWGGNSHPDQGGGGEVGAGVAKPPLHAAQFWPPDFTANGYTDGMEVRDLVVFNIGPIKAITGKDDFEVRFRTDPLIKVEGGGSGPQTIYYIWGTPSGYGHSLPALAGNPVFTLAPGGSTGTPPYYAAPFAVADIGTTNPLTVPYYQAIHWSLSTYPLPPGVPVCPHPFPIPFQSAAEVQTVIDWAAAIGILGPGTGFSWNSLTSETGTIPGGEGPGITQPEQNIEWTFELFTTPPATLPTDENAPVNYFPVDGQNVPMWDHTKAKAKEVRTIGGSAPQVAKTFTVKVSKEKVLTVTPIS